MSELFHTDTTPQHICWDRKTYSTFEDQVRALKGSRTLYVGNLSFYTTELQILETFRIVGPVKRVIMGLNAFSKTPCGFCFVEYYSNEHACAALQCISGTILDDRVIRCDIDSGFIAGRQFGRGNSGGQVRDNRGTSDPARGGIVQPHNNSNNNYNNRNGNKNNYNNSNSNNQQRYNNNNYNSNNNSNNNNYNRRSSFPHDNNDRRYSGGNSNDSFSINRKRTHEDVDTVTKLDRALSAPRGRATESNAAPEDDRNKRSKVE